MSFRPRTNRLTLLRIASAFLLAAIAYATPLACDATADPDPVIGRVAGHAIRLSDADALRVLLTPPPSLEAAERLAIDVALVWWDHHGSFEQAPAKARLKTWRAWLAEVERTAEVGRMGELVQRRLGSIKARANSGALPAP